MIIVAKVSNYAEAGTSTNSQDESWSKYTPTKLRIPKTPALKLSENKGLLPVIINEL